MWAGLGNRPLLLSRAGKVTAHCRTIRLAVSPPVCQTTLQELSYYCAKKCYENNLQTMILLLLFFAVTLPPSSSSTLTPTDCTTHAICDLCMCFGGNYRLGIFEVSKKETNTRIHVARLPLRLFGSVSRSDVCAHTYDQWHECACMCARARI